MDNKNQLGEIALEIGKELAKVAIVSVLSFYCNSIQKGSSKNVVDYVKQVNNIAKNKLTEGK